MYSRSFPKKTGLLFVFLSRIAFGGDVIPPVSQVLSTSRQLIDENRSDQAVALLESSRIESARQNDPRSEALILNLLGMAYEQQGKYVAARNAFDGSVSRLTRAEGKDTPELIKPLNNLANLLYESGQGSQAEALVRRVLGILAVAGPPGEDTGAELAILAKMYLGERKLSLALQSAQDSLDLLRRSGHSEAIAAAMAWAALGGVYVEQRDNTRAEDSLEQSLSILRKNLDPQDYRLAEGVANLGLLYAHQSLPEKADPLLEEAHACFRAQAVNTLFVRSFLSLWADAERKAGHTDKARDLTKEAKTLMSGRAEASFAAYLVDASSCR